MKNPISPEVATALKQGGVNFLQFLAGAAVFFAWAACILKLLAMSYYISGVILLLGGLFSGFVLITYFENKRFR